MSAKDAFEFINPLSAFKTIGNAFESLVPKPKTLDPPTREDTSGAVQAELDRQRRKRGRAQNILTGTVSDPVVGRSTLLGG